MTQIKKSTLEFLKDLQINNNRDWFKANEATYKAAKENVTVFLEDMQGLLNQHDHIEKKKLYRIFRDVRFSKDKSPYKGYFGGYFGRAGAARRGGYFFSLEPGGQTKFGGGFGAPNKEDLLRIRQEIEMDGDRLRSILESDPFKSTFNELLGHGVKTAPRGFDAAHPHIDLIRKKAFYAYRFFSDKEVCSSEFIHIAHESFQALRPYFDYMSEVLTTDINGESII